jgi:hypothetical protein
MNRGEAMKPARHRARKAVWIALVVIFALATAGSIYETLNDPASANLTGVVVKAGLVAAMIYVARRDIREMDTEE